MIVSTQSFDQEHVTRNFEEIDESDAMTMHVPKVETQR